MTDETFRLMHEAEILHKRIKELMENTKFQDEFSKEIWQSTYKDHSDENVDDTFRRVATYVASVEPSFELQLEWQQKFYDALTDFKITAGGRIYSNAGTEWAKKGTGLLNCYVAPRKNKDIDSLNNILDTVKDQSNTLKSEGGWGENFSYIRPRGGFIHGVGVETPGAVKYMEIFDKTSDVITSGSGRKSKNKKAKGKIRKGAMMGVLDVWHPDIFEFITAKQNAGRLTKFNMSVNCTNEFMARVIEIEDNGCDEFDEIDIWDLKFPDTTYSKYSNEWDGDLELWESKGYPTIIHDTVSVKHLWNIIMESTYNRAEPGILWCDRANEFNPAYYIEKIRATNPCGEQFLAESGVCDLASYNLTQYIEEDSSGGHYFNFEKFEKYISVGVRFLDNVNTVSNSPLPEYKDSMLNKRRIGLGILGWGSLLFMLKIRFGSTDANTLRDKIMQTLATKSYEYSIDLAIEKGMFTYCDPIKHADGKFIQNLHLSQEYMDKLRTTGIRNSSLLSCQPTGNTSIFANIVSGGIEPVFMPEYIRTVIVNSMPEEISHVCPKWYEGEWNETDVFSFTKEGDEEILKGEMNGIMYKIDKNRGLTKEVLCEDYGIRWLKARGEYDPKADYIVTTTELTADDHLNDLKGFARWVDSALSKTINLPNDYSFENFKNVYLDTYKTGYIKGITTYRAGTMTTVLSSVDDLKEEEIILDDVKMPDSASATIKTIKAEGKKWYLTIVYHTDSDKPFALFVKTNSNEKTVNANNAVEVLTKLAYKKGIPEQHIETTIGKINQDSNASKITRIISLMLRHGVLIKNIVLALDTIEDVFVGSFLFQIKKFLSSYVKDGEKVEGAKCENCGSDKIEFSEGCFKCVECGSSKCG